MSKSVEGPNLYKDEKKIYWHIQTVDEVLKETNSSKKGLEDKQAHKLLEQNGKNNIIKKEKFKLLKSFIRKFNNILVYVLFVTALISLYLGHPVEFYVIMVIIAFTVLLSFIQEFRAEKSVEALSKLTAKKVEVIRGGHKKQILAEDLVPGDVVILKRGLIVPADLRIIESNGLRINESILTGESVPKGKISTPLKDHELGIADTDNIAYSGTSIMNGTGLGVVVATGFNSEIGKISKKLASIGIQKTPLQKKIDTMTHRISYAVIFLCIIVYFILLLKGVETPAALLLVAALAVSAIPEGFPLALTLALSSGVKRMAKNNAVIKDMGSVETLGTTTVICTDKTGTLTQNKMLAVKVNFNSDHDIDVDGKPYEPNSVFKLKGKEISKKELQKRHDFFYTAILCNNAEIINKEGNYQLSGEPTEGAMLSLAASAGFDEEVVREENKRIHEEPFDSTKKYMVSINEDGKNSAAYLKGAVEKVLEKSSYMYSHGKIVKLTDKQKQKILKHVHNYTNESLRVLGLGIKHFKGKNKKELIKKSEKDYIFLGMIGIHDPIREDVVEAIKECKSAGIKTVMVTGDHKSTAIVIGRQLGLIQSKYDLVLEGKDIDSMNDEELDEAMPNVKIFARTTPDHKLRIVKSQQRLGEIVAMTGDGVNDAPALKKADIGVSMGLEGTDVARESSNMILMDDAFSTIVKAVKEGRTIYSNIRRFTYYMLTINIAEALIILIAIMFNLINPLTALMILFINVITSTIPSFGLSLEPTNKKVMEYKPRDPKEKLLSEYILLRVAAVSPLLVMLTLGFFLWELYYGGAEVERARTLAFATIVVFELFHAFNARSLHTTIFQKRFFTNKFFFASIAISTIILILSIHTNFGQSILQTTPLAGFDWLIVILLGSTAILTSEIIKLLIKIEMTEQSKLQGRTISF
ncbi:MAG: cation-translocating P-type ATPase [Candidatus Woesearchaeota archaeon]